MTEIEQLIWRLRNAPPNVLLQREAADAIERLQYVMRQRDANAAKELREEQRGASIEASWQASQGDEYGSY